MTLPLRIAAVLVMTSLCMQPTFAQNAKTTGEMPLEFDPAKPERIEGWWSNGVELMRLDPNGAYRLWVSQDRFKRPQEVGAWRRTNYVYFDLEPYRSKPITRHRVNMQKEDGVTELVRAGMKPFRASPGPPHIPADDMLGAWIASSEELLVLDSGRYEWRRTSPNATGITEISGLWNTDGDVLTLAPDSPAVDNTTLRSVRGDDGQFRLEGAHGVMVHPPLEALQPTDRAAKPAKNGANGSASKPNAPAAPAPKSAAAAPASAPAAPAAPTPTAPLPTPASSSPLPPKSSLHG